MVKKELLEELRQIIKEDYDEDIDDRQLYLIGNGMVKYFDLLAKIYHRMQKNKQAKDDNPTNNN